MDGLFDKLLQPSSDSTYYYVLFAHQHYTQNCLCKDTKYRSENNLWSLSIDWNVLQHSDALDIKYQKPHKAGNPVTTLDKKK